MCQIIINSFPSELKGIQCLLTIGDLRTVDTSKILEDKVASFSWMKWENWLGRLKRSTTRSLAKISHSLST